MATRVGISVQQSQSINLKINTGGRLRGAGTQRPQKQPPQIEAIKDRVSLSPEGLAAEDELQTEPGSKAALNRQILQRTFGINAENLDLKNYRSEPDANNKFKDLKAPGYAQPPPFRSVEGDTFSISIEQNIQININIGSQLPRGGTPEEGTPEEGTPEDKRQDPLALDLNGNGQIDLSTAREGIRFDINADGRADQTAFVTNGDAFLALDRNGDGRINSGAELFGDADGSADGFADLAALDSNRDGLIDASDDRFGDLRVFDGSSTRSLSEVGVSSISLDARYGTTERPDGNAEIAQSTFTRSNGQRARIADVLLAYAQG